MDHGGFFEKRVGFVPSRVGARLEQGRELDPSGSDGYESAVVQALSPGCFDVKTTQLILWGILLGQGLMGNGARWNAVAARRAGASWEELHAVARLAAVHRGTTALNLAAEIIADLRRQERERQADTAAG